MEELSHSKPDAGERGLSPEQTRSFGCEDEYPRGTLKGVITVRLDHQSTQPPAVGLTVWLSDTITRGSQYRRISHIRVRDDVDHRGFLEVFRFVEDASRNLWWAHQNGVAVDPTSIGLTELVEGHCIAGSLAATARRCTVCSVHEIRGGDQETQRITVHTYQVPVEVVKNGRAKSRVVQNAGV